MVTFLKRRFAAAHSQRLERWLGAAAVENLSQSMRGWYGRPLPIVGVPGRVYAGGDGDFCGPLRGGYAANLLDFAWDRARRISRHWLRDQGRTAAAGFASLSDLINEATTGGKRRDFWFKKNGTAAGATGDPMSLWNVGPYPPAGGVGGTSGTGRVCTDATTGGFLFSNPTGGDTQHFVSATVHANVANGLMLYDRLWDMTYNHASSTSTAIDANNRPNRYQTAAAAPGNFISGEVTTALSATAHNLTHTYVDQDGNAAEAAAAYAAPVSAAVNRLPLVTPNWFVPLNSGDSGARYLTNIAQSTITSVTGVSNFFIGHPLAIIPIPIAQMSFVLDGLNSAFNLAQILDDACLCFLELPKTATTSTSYMGNIITVAG